MSRAMLSRKIHIDTHYLEKEIVAIIPARGGSKGISRKNLVDLGGKPLIAHTIDVAVNSKMITRVVVSTDDLEIAQTAQEYGAEVPFMRPGDLAGDHSSLNDVVSFTIQQLESSGNKCDVVAIMLPTHPFRNVQQIDSLLRLLLDNHTMVCTSRKIPVSAASYLTLKEDGGIVPSFGATKKECSYLRNYGLLTAYNRTQQPAINGFYIHALKDPISLIDIDSYDDLEKARIVLLHNLFDFGFS